MIFFSLLAALGLDHFRPLRRPLPHAEYFEHFAAYLREKLDGGERLHGAIAWGIAVLPPALLVGLVHAGLSNLNYLIGWAFGVGVLYLTMGLKYYSRIAEDIAARLRSNQLDAAREILRDWRGGGTASMDAREVASATIEQLFVQSHRQTFGVLFWFVLLGPMGAVLFRLASLLSLRWHEATPPFAGAAATIFHVLNWLPVRLTALTYAVAGDFEDAFYCWRTQAQMQPGNEEGVVLAAGAGAMGVRLAQPMPAGEEWRERVEFGLGEEADADQIESAGSMIWRGLMVWLVLALLAMAASWAA
ncbi:MAG: CobD/CbiB family protein [Pseudomonadota bacterium]